MGLKKEKKNKGSGHVSSALRQKLSFIYLFLIDIFWPCSAPSQTCHLVGLEMLNTAPGSRESLWHQNGMGKTRRTKKVCSVKEKGSCFSSFSFPFFLLWPWLAGGQTCCLIAIGEAIQSAQGLFDGKWGNIEAKALLLRITASEISKHQLLW